MLASVESVENVASKGDEGRTAYPVLKAKMANVGTMANLLMKSQLQMALLAMRHNGLNLLRVKKETMEREVAMVHRVSPQPLLLER
nr:MAG TPA: hypothetical protein [Caudoviricetes sp.]